MQLKDWQFDKDHVKSWAEEGKKAGSFAQQAFTAAESSVMKMLLTIAAIIAGHPSQEDFLTGYATAWSNPNTAKSRKTDARAVMDAYALKDAEGKGIVVEFVVGYEKNPDGTAKLDDKKMPTPIKESKTAQEWLTSYEGDFAGFLKLARDLRNRGTGKESRGTAVSRKAKVTDTQFSNIMENIPVMTLNQAHSTITEAAKQVAKMPNWERAVLAEMELFANQLKTSNQPIFQNAAAEIIDTLNGLRDALGKDDAAKAQAQREAAAQLHGTAKGDFKAPAPAQEQKKVA